MANAEWERLKEALYEVTFTDGTVSDVAVPVVEGEHISLWDIVNRDLVSSWESLGYY